MNSMVSAYGKFCRNDLKLVMDTQNTVGISLYVGRAPWTHLERFLTAPRMTIDNNDQTELTRLDLTRFKLMFEYHFIQ